MNLPLSRNTEIDQTNLSLIKTLAEAKLTPKFRFASNELILVTYCINLVKDNV